MPGLQATVDRRNSAKRYLDRAVALTAEADLLEEQAAKRRRLLEKTAS
jgi:hypothetical protein